MVCNPLGESPRSNAGTNRHWQPRDSRSSNLEDELTATTSYNVRSGWSKTGLWPFNPDRVLGKMSKPSDIPPLSVICPNANAPLPSYDTPLRTPTDASSFTALVKRFFHHNLSKSFWLRSHAFYIRKDEVQDEVREHIREQHLSSAFDGGLGSVHTHDLLAVPDVGADLVPGQVYKPFGVLHSVHALAWNHSMALTHCGSTNSLRSTHRVSNHFAHVLTSTLVFYLLLVIWCSCAEQLSTLQHSCTSSLGRIDSVLLQEHQD